MCVNCEFLFSIHHREQKTLLFMGLQYATNHVDVKNRLPLKRSWLEKTFEKKIHINLLLISLRFGVELLFFPLSMRVASISKNFIL
jgi:hypothetical protein